MFLWLLDLSMGMVIKLGAIVLFTPIFFLPGVGVAVFGFYLGNMYLKAQLSVKRETRYVHEVLQEPTIADVVTVMLVLPCWHILVQPSTESVCTRVNIDE